VRGKSVSLKYGESRWGNHGGVILKSVLRHTATGLSRTIAGQEDNTGTTAYAGTSVFARALGFQL